MSDILRVDRLELRVPTRSGLKRIVSDVSLRVGPGESLGLVGESGSGKSMSMRAALRMLPERSEVGGTVTFEGADVTAFDRARLRSWRRHEVGTIHQDPRAHINPLRTIGDFLTEVTRDEAGADRSEARHSACRMLKSVGITDPERRMRQYPHQLSGGLLQRVMIAAAMLPRPRLLVADEPTTALDVTTQRDVMRVLDEQRSQRAMAMVFITHDLDLAAAVTDRISVLYAGAIAETGPSTLLTEAPLHPYTAGLLASRPGLRRVARLRSIPGRPISADEVAGGCPFAQRCAFVTELCRETTPPLRVLDGREVACHRAEELRGELVLTAGREVADVER